MSNTSATSSLGTTTPAPPAMRAVVGRRYGGPESLAIEQVATPTPDADHVLVKVEASSLNALDWHMRTGTPYFLRVIEGIRRPRRLIDGADVAGTVVAVGSDVTDLVVGDEVFGVSNGGGFGEYLVTKPHGLVRKPEGVSFEAAGATGVAGLTALQGLRTHGDVQPGDHVLINGAAGGVGTFAVQIAKALGAEVTAVCSTRNVDMVRSLGADHVIDYVSEDFVPGGARFDVMLDGAGNRSAKECLSVLNPEGRFVSIGGPKGNPWLDPIPHIAAVALRFLRADQSFRQFTASPNHKDLTFLGELLADGRLVPEVDRVIGLEGVAHGLAEIGTGHARAKIVVIPAPS